MITCDSKPLRARQRLTATAAVRLNARIVSIPTALVLALAQLSDRRILALLMKSVAISLVVTAGLAWAIFAGVRTGFGGILTEAESWSGLSGASALLGIVAAALGAWLLWRLVAMAVLQFYADAVVEAVEERHYPELTARPVPLREQVAQAARGAIRALVANMITLPFAIALIVTGVGTAMLFALVNGWLLGRELQDMVWLRHAPARRAGAKPAPPLSPISRFLLGLVVVGLLAVPFVNLVAPFLGAAMATHLVHRRTAGRPIVS